MYTCAERQKLMYYNQCVWVVLNHLVTVQMTFVPDYKDSSFNPEKLAENKITPTAERIDFHEDYANLWSKVGRGGRNSTVAQACLVSHQLVSPSHKNWTSLSKYRSTACGH